MAIHRIAIAKHHKHLTVVIRILKLSNIIFVDLALGISFMFQMMFTFLNDFIFVSDMYGLAKSAREL